MTRKQRIILITAAIALFAATLKGFDYMQAGRTNLGSIMLVSALLGWILLAWRLLVIRRAHRADPP